MTTFAAFFHMGGYAAYVWPAYLSVMVFLLLGWWMPWRRWKKYLSEQQKITHE